MGQLAFLSFYSDKKSLASKNPVSSFDNWSQNMPKIYMRKLLLAKHCQDSN